MPMDVAFITKKYLHADSFLVPAGIYILFMTALNVPNTESLRVVERAGKTQTLIVCPSASPLFTVLPVFLIVASTVP